MTFFGVCDFCHEPVNGKIGTDSGPAFTVLGWEILREGGGANQIHGRERTGGVRHVRCLPDKIQDDAQGRLI